MYRLLTGADMDPLLVRRTYPEARFVARARLDPKTAASKPVWGILLDDVASQHTGGADSNIVPVVTDEGRAYDATVAGDGSPPGEPAAVLAAAKYWELPPAYIRSLPGGDAFPDGEG